MLAGVEEQLARGIPVGRLIGAAKLPGRAAKDARKEVVVGFEQALESRLGVFRSAQCHAERRVRVVADGYALDEQPPLTQIVGRRVVLSDVAEETPERLGRQPAP